MNVSLHIFLLHLYRSRWNFVILFYLVGYCYWVYILFNTNILIHSDKASLLFFPFIGMIILIRLTGSFITKLIPNGENRRLWSYSATYKFGVNLLALTYHYQSLDTTITAKEKRQVKRLMVGEFGKWRAKFYIMHFKPTKLMADMPLKKVLAFLLEGADTKSRIQILDYVVSIFTTDKYLSKKELTILKALIKKIRIPTQTLEAVLAMHNYTTEEEVEHNQSQSTIKQYGWYSLRKYYKILELNEGASLREVKNSYRNLVKQYHPDKLLDANKQHTEIAKEKLQLIQEAYDKIKEKLHE